MLTPIALALAAAEGGGGGLLSVDATLLWATLVVFALFAWILGKFAWGPLLKIVDEREKTIREQVDSAQLAAAEAKDLLAQHQEMLRGAGREREEILQKAVKEAEHGPHRPRDEGPRRRRPGRGARPRADAAGEGPGDRGAAGPGGRHRGRGRLPHREVVAHRGGAAEARGRLHQGAPRAPRRRGGRERGREDLQGPLQALQQGQRQGRAQLLLLPRRPREVDRPHHEGEVRGEEGEERGGRLLLQGPGRALPRRLERGAPARAHGLPHRQGQEQQPPAAEGLREGLPEVRLVATSPPASSSSGRAAAAS